MSAEPLDLAQIMTRHEGHWQSGYVCLGGREFADADHCLPYRLAESLADERAVHEAEVSVLVGEGIRQKRRANAERARAQRVEAALAYLGEQYGSLLAVHESVVMDTPEGRELHDKAVAAFKAAVGMSAALAGETEVSP